MVLEKCWKATDKREEALEGVSEVPPGTEEYEVVQNSFLYEQATLLVAFGLENMLKALWAEQRSEQIKDSESLPRPIQEHDLNDLAQETNLEISSEEDEALEVLTQHSIWAGRYPIPLNASDYVEKHGEIERTWILQNHPGEVAFPDEVDSLIRKIWSKIEEIDSN